MESRRRYEVADFIVRIALGLIFVYTAIGKLFLGAMPPLDKVLPFIPLNISVYLLGLLELVLGILLLAGLFTRIAAWVTAALYLIFIGAGLALGLFNAAGLFNDVGLLAAAVATALIGCTKWGLDCLFHRKAAQKTEQKPAQ